MLSDSAEVREAELYGGRCRGVFAKALVRSGEVIWSPRADGESGHGWRIFHHCDLDAESDETVRANLALYSHMTADDTYASSSTLPVDPRLFFNHSCEPNCWLNSDDSIVAFRDVQPGEQLTYDYALTETEASLHAGMRCKCGAPGCRDLLDFRDWRSPEWRRRCAGHWSRHVQRKVEECGWHDPRACVRHLAGGDDDDKGLFCLAPIRKGELVVVFAGNVATLADLLELGPKHMQHNLQVNDNLWQIPTAQGPETGDHFNHSCDPNCGLEDSTTVVALRDIPEGEQITIDYGTVNSGKVQAVSDNFECRCGAPGCRKLVTSSDYRLPEVQKRYWPYFPPFMKRLILSLPADECHVPRP